MVYVAGSTGREAKSPAERSVVRCRDKIPCYGWFANCLLHLLPCNVQTTCAVQRSNHMTGQTVSRRGEHGRCPDKIPGKSGSVLINDCATISKMVIARPGSWIDTILVISKTVLTVAKKCGVLWFSYPDQIGSCSWDDKSSNCLKQRVTRHISSLAGGWF